MASNKKDIFLTNVIIDYPHLAEPHAFEDDAKPKYSVEILISKEANIADVKAAIKEVANKEFGNNAGDVLREQKRKNGSVVIRDGDELYANAKQALEENPESDNARNREENLRAWRGYYVIRASSHEEYPPELVKRNLSKIMPKEVDTLLYAGAVVNVDAIISAYSSNKASGVTCYLNGVQFVKHAEPIKHASSKGSKFKKLDEDNDDGDTDLTDLV